MFRSELNKLLVGGFSDLEQIVRQHPATTWPSYIGHLMAGRESDESTKQERRTPNDNLGWDFLQSYDTLSFRLAELRHQFYLED